MAKRKKLDPLPTDAIPVKEEYRDNQVRNERGLNPRQELFCLEYMRDLNATAAYIRAGYNCRDAKDAAAGLMAKPAVQDRIDELKAQRNARIAMSSDKVLEMLVTVYEKGIDAGDLGPAVRAAQLLGNHVNLFKEHNVQTVKLAGLSNSDSKEDVDNDIKRLLPIALYAPAKRDAPESE